VLDTRLTANMSLYIELPIVIVLSGIDVMFVFLLMTLPLQYSTHPTEIPVHVWIQYFCMHFYWMLTDITELTC